MIREWKERWSFVGEPRSRVVVSAPIKGRPTDIDITDEMRSACESLIAPLCETTVDLLARVEPEYQERVRNNIVLAGGTSLIAGLPEALQKALAEFGGGRVTVVKDPVFAGSDGSLAIARDASTSDWEKLSL
jgi:rod shape-determining protein MreB and related proteins